MGAFSRFRFLMFCKNDFPQNSRSVLSMQAELKTQSPFWLVCRGLKASRLLHGQAFIPLSVLAGPHDLWAWPTKHSLDSPSEMPTRHASLRLGRHVPVALSPPQTFFLWESFLTFYIFFLSTEKRNARSCWFPGRALCCFLWPQPKAINGCVWGWGGSHLAVGVRFYALSA